MAVFANNSTVSPEGISRILLFYGLITRTSRRIPKETKLVRAKEIEAGMKEAEKYQARSRLNFALRHTRGPTGVAP